MMEPYYDDGQIQIWLGDCRDVLSTIELGSVDLVLTDPPYQSLDVEVNTGTTTRLVSRDLFGGKSLAAKDGAAWFSTLSTDVLAGVWDTARLALSDTGALYVFADVKSGLDMFPALKPRNVLVWDKGSIGMGYGWRRMHEWIAYCPMPKHKLRDASVGDILRYAGVSEKTHPTEKPVSLLQVIIRNSTDAGALVIDPFMGSGSTLRAAQNLGRRAIGIDVSEAHCATAVRRLQQSVLPLEIPA